MKITYFQDTDTLYIEFRAGSVSETRDLDENTLLDLDAEGQVVALTLEHASERADVPHFSYEQVAA
ncbi:DUF2283 domain-containing protein [Metallibacterium sp.]|uniref:DUF2283 domain-containing protein n=1 Tax=Metallibacterium sp. TaxID=2940281 RepID=UPI00261BFE8E|nr:DUF2283 domain-containing protein [Metallibacterium sp.]